jgi:hypothetical protein
MIRTTNWPATSAGTTLLALMAIVVACVLTTPAVATIEYTIGTKLTGGTRLIGQALGSNAEPPMPMGAAGPNRVVEFSSSTFTTYSKTGNLVERIGHRPFWQQALQQAGTPGGVVFPSSTHVLYDDHTDRWYAVAVDRRNTNENNLLIGVTLGSDPASSNWRAFTADINSLNDSKSVPIPQIGINGDALYVVGDLYSPGVFVTEEVNFFGIPLSSLTAPVPSINGMRRQERVVANSTGLSFQPAVDLDGGTGALPGAAYFNSNYRKRTTIPADWLEGTADMPAANFPADYAFDPITRPDQLSDQPGSVDLYSGDDAFIGNVVQQNGSLWAVHTVLNNGRHALKWYEFMDLAGQFAIKQTGLIADPILEYFLPSIAVNDFGDVAIGFSGSSNATPVSAFLAVGDTQNGITSFDSPLMTHAGTGAYTLIGAFTVPRWGMFSATTVDPANPYSFWTFQAFTQTGSNWAVGVTQVIVAPEPSSVALMALAALALAKSRRRPLRPRPSPST